MKKKTQMIIYLLKRNVQRKILKKIIKEKKQNQSQKKNLKIKIKEIIQIKIIKKRELKIN